MSTAHTNSARELVYEVNLQIDRAVITEYLPWLHGHVARMLALPGFLSAQVFEVVESASQQSADTDRIELCVHYRLRDAAALDAYLQKHAAHMRAEGEALFSGRYAASRRVLQVIEDAA